MENSSHQDIPLQKSTKFKALFFMLLFGFVVENTYLYAKGAYQNLHTPIQTPISSSAPINSPAMTSRKVNPNRLYLSSGLAHFNLQVKPLDGWDNMSRSNSNTIILTKNSYTLSFADYATSDDSDYWWDHAGICFFPDNEGYKNRKTYVEPVGYYEIPTYKEIKVVDGVIRRGKTVDSSHPQLVASEMVCFKNKGEDANHFSQASIIGYATINYPPGNPEPKLLGEIDQILSTIRLYDSTYPVDLREWLVGKTFLNAGASGEWGTFEKNGVLTTEHGLEYVPNDTRSPYKTGKWGVEGEQLIIEGTTLSNSTYDQFTFVTYKGSLLAEQGIVIGPSKEVIEAYIKSTKTN